MALETKIVLLGYFIVSKLKENHAKRVKTENALYIFLAASQLSQEIKISCGFLFCAFTIIIIRYCADFMCIQSIWQLNI